MLRRCTREKRCECGTNGPPLHGHRVWTRITRTVWCGSADFFLDLLRGAQGSLKRARAVLDRTLLGTARGSLQRPHAGLLGGLLFAQECLQRVGAGLDRVLLVLVGDASTLFLGLGLGVHCGQGGGELGFVLRVQLGECGCQLCVARGVHCGCHSKRSRGPHRHELEARLRAERGRLLTDSWSRSSR